MTPRQLRRRMVSVNMMFFMGGPQLGELEGAWRYPPIRRYDHVDDWNAKRSAKGLGSRHD